MVEGAFNFHNVMQPWIDLTELYTLVGLNKYTHYGKKVKVTLY